MAKIFATFIGDPVDRTPDPTTGLPRAATSGGVVNYGVTFPVGVPQDVSHLAVEKLEKLRGNPHFEVTEAEPAPVVVTPRPVSKTAPPAPGNAA